MLDPAAQVDTGRCVVHVDVDAFYAQCEELRNPALKERPLGVTQKYLIVTSNYPARRRGVTKLMGTVEAKQKCPELVLVSGEDLTPYRQASKQILAVLQRFGICERGGMDEMLVDVTAEAQNRLHQGFISSQWAAHVHSNEVELVADNKHRPQDLRTLALRGAIDNKASVAYAHCSSVAQASGTAWESLLMAGCVIAQEMRAALKAEVGFRCSAGIASNRMLAKLVSGLHKPDDQTVILPPDAAAFVAPLPVRALPGVGYKMEQELTQMGIKTAADLRQLSKESLSSKFGERTSTFLHLACRGVDATPVQDKGPPKSITVEDSFKDCSSVVAAEHVIQVLAPDLLARMVEDQQTFWETSGKDTYAVTPDKISAGNVLGTFQETSRHAGTLTLKWRHKGHGWTRSSTSCPMPKPLQAPQQGNAAHVALLANTLMAMLKKNVQEPFHLTLLNIGVTNFVTSKRATASGSWNPAFAKLLQPVVKKQKLDHGQDSDLPLNGASDSRSAAMQSQIKRRSYGAQPSSACISKSTERALMEQSRGQHQKALHGLSPNAILDDLCYADEEEQEGQEEDVWERPSSIQRPYAVNHQMLEMHTQLSAAVKHVPKHVGPLQQFASQHHANSVLEQQSLTVHAQAAEPHHEQEIQQQQELHFSMQPRSLAAADGTISGTAVCSLPHVPLCVMNASQRGTSANAKHNSAASLTDAVQQCAAAEQSDVGTEAVQLPTHQAGAVPVSDGALPVHTEQSDRELALRLQQEEHAVQHQQARPVSKRLLTVKSDCKKTNSIQSFFKKA